MEVCLGDYSPKVDLNSDRLMLHILWVSIRIRFSKAAGGSSVSIDSATSTSMITRLFDPFLEGR